MDVLLIILLIFFLLIYFGPWIAKKLLLWQMKKMQKRMFDAFGQSMNGAEQQAQSPQQAPQQPKRPQYNPAAVQDAHYQEIRDDEQHPDTSPSRSFTPEAKVTDARWEEIK